MEKEFREELAIQKRIAHTAGILQGDITIKTLLESLAEGVVIVNDMGRVIMINNRFAELSGYNKEEVMGESISIFIPEKSREKHAEHIMKFFTEPRIRPMGMGVALSARRKDGTEFPVEISLSHLDMENGKLGVAFITDITSRKTAEDELIQKNAELDQYAHTVAHDLHGSLAGVIGISEILLSEQSGISEEQKQYLKMISQGGMKMKNIIKELLLFATITKEELNIQDTNIQDLVNAAIKRLQHIMEKSNAKIEFLNPLHNCKGYGPWIEEVFYNLLSNAIKYGGENPHIQITSQQKQDGSVEYQVIDHGEGIESELLEVIFEDNSKIKNSKMLGTGLGLSIVRRIMEKLDGTVSAKSELNKGSVFSFTLSTN